jgi:hypothetical protein
MNNLLGMSKISQNNFSRVETIITKDPEHMKELITVSESKEAEGIILG